MHPSAHGLFVIRSSTSNDFARLHASSAALLAPRGHSCVWGTFAQASLTELRQQRLRFLFDRRCLKIDFNVVRSLRLRRSSPGIPGSGSPKNQAVRSLRVWLGDHDPPTLGDRTGSAVTIGE
jgi:hypothetical protein